MRTQGSTSAPPAAHTFGDVGVATARTQTTEREGEVPPDIETETSNGGAGSASQGSASSCGLTGRFLGIPSPMTLRAALTGTRLHRDFTMSAEFTSTGGAGCTCACGEYRQYVRGTFTANGTTVAHSLGGGRTLDPTTFQEDGDVAAGTVYGHRSVLGTKSKFAPDQAAGCRFEGADEPGISSSISGTVLAMNLDFTAELIDTCRNVTLTGADWSVAGKATIP